MNYYGKEPDFWKILRTIWGSVIMGQGKNFDKISK